MKLQNFRVEELVTPQAYELLGDLSINLFNPGFLSSYDQFVTDIKRDLGVKSVIVNDWVWNGSYRDSGLRDGSTDKKFSRGSQHFVGNATDSKFNGCTIQQAADYLLENESQYPGIKRIEDLDFTPSWFHLDGKETGNNFIYIFKP